ncbi:hypothetical protein HOK15_00890 [Candidatus Falkowbacteria bacterium]|nr:hypothetical protein [Candidatus Falkowbacteria bacterium]MBT5502748.1 hypothetical protein [Candidatus Falkowbacteria bacterium]
MFKEANVGVCSLVGSVEPLSFGEEYYWSFCLSSPQPKRWVFCRHGIVMSFYCHWSLEVLDIHAKDSPHFEGILVQHP